MGDRPLLKVVKVTIFNVGVFDTRTTINREEVSEFEFVFNFIIESFYGHVERPAVMG